jgi:hypothetical protein
MTKSSLANTPAQQPPRHRIHFARGQIHLFLRHRPGRSAEEIIGAIYSTGLFQAPSNDDAKQAPLRNAASAGQPQVFFSTERVWTFDTTRFEGPGPARDDAFSLVFASAPALQDEDELLRYLEWLIRQCPRRGGRDGEASYEDVEIVQAGPDWLSAGSPEPDGSGGPGGKPVEPSAGSVTYADLAPIELPKELDLRRKEPGKCAHVFILDTAPCELDLRRAYKKWVTEPMLRGEPPHPILVRLLGPNGALGEIDGNLRIEYAGGSHLLEVANAFLPDHDYVMADHGLFIAGIINTYAPAAKLHLVEVLNPYGMGTLETIARGFTTVAEFVAQNPCAKVVINASLFLGVHQKDQLPRAMQLDVFWRRARDAGIDLSVRSLRELCDFIHRHVAQIVAAAGNDGRNENGVVIHPDARYPAAYPKVVGVAALVDKQLAFYSNKADVQLSEGIVAPGGKKNRTGENTDPDEGMLGVYIGSYPDGRPNRSGLARWSGTSFAAPVVSAAFAALLCEGLSAKQALDRIKLLHSDVEPVLGADALRVPRPGGAPAPLPE